MAVIGKIRGKATLLIVIVGFSLFAFILGDLLSNNQNFFGNNDTTAGVIAGRKINVQDFEARVQTLVDNHKLNTSSESIDQNTMDQLREQAWNQLVNEEVMDKQYEKIGITVSSEELFDMIKGKNPHPQIKQAFTDPKTGQFNPAAVINFLKNMDNDQTGRTRAQWVLFERAIRDERIQQKYNDLIKQGIYVSSVEAKEDFINKNRTASARYVNLPYASIPDSAVTITDADLKSVYNANLKKYKQTASRSLEYVSFDVLPSDVDKKAELDEITKLAEEFKTVSNDSGFAAMNSDVPVDNSYHKRGTLPVSIDSLMFSSAIGTVAGPIEENGAFKVYKLSSSKALPDSVKASHILLKADNPTAFTTADSIKKAVEGGASFELLNFMYSTDEAAKMKGGDLGFFGAGQMVQPFSDACFNASKGEILIVTTQFGIHIIKVVDQKGSSTQVKVATIEKKIEPSSKTTQIVFAKANQFANNNNTSELFDKAVKDQNLTKLNETNIIESARQVGPLENSRELVRWAFKGKVGEVSKAYEFGNHFVIAKLTEVREKGYSSLEEVKDQVTIEAKKDKKAEMLIEKFKKAGNASNLDAIAGAVAQQITVADNVSFGSPFLGNAGMEGNVVGHIMVMKAGQVSQPIKGQNGVYVVAVTSFKEAEVPKDLKESAKQLGQQIQGRSQYEVYNALREKADIDDRRGKFY